jgi:hypothetical protein
MRPGNTLSSLLACASDTLLFTAVPSFDLRRIAHTLPSGADGLEGPPPTKFYELRDNPIAVGVTVWEFTSQHWAKGVTWAVLVAVMAAAYLIGERRRTTGKKGGRRY